MAIYPSLYHCYSVRSLPFPPNSCQWYVLSLVQTQSRHTISQDFSNLVGPFPRPNTKKAYHFPEIFGNGMPESTSHAKRLQTTNVRSRCIILLSRHNLHRHIQDLRHLQNGVNMASDRRAHVMGRAGLAPAVHEFAGAAGEAGSHVGVAEF